jgi:hypothetical protein
MTAHVTTHFREDELQKWLESHKFEHSDYDRWKHPAISGALTTKQAIQVCRGMDLGNRVIDKCVECGCEFMRTYAYKIDKCVMHRQGKAPVRKTKWRNITIEEDIYYLLMEKRPLGEPIKHYIARILKEYVASTGKIESVEVAERPA